MLSLPLRLKFPDAVCINIARDYRPEANFLDHDRTTLSNPRRAGKVCACLFYRGMMCP